jgi:hypothetical protein
MVFCQSYNYKQIATYTVKKMNPYTDFKERFKLLVSKQHHLVVNTLSNIFTMRLIGNKTHGDLAEIGIAEFINQFMYDFKSIHVGKDLFRAKEHEEDIVIINEINKTQFPLSLKAYGDGPLQLSTDSDQKMFPSISIYNEAIENVADIKKLLNDSLPKILDAKIVEIIHKNKSIQISDEELLKEIIKDISEVSKETLILSILDSRKGKITDTNLLQIIQNALEITSEDKVQIKEIRNGIKSAKCIIEKRKDEIKETKNKIKEINTQIQPRLSKNGKDIRDKGQIDEIFNSVAFADFGNLNILPLIYDEKDKKCNIMVFDHFKAKQNTARILYVGKSKKFDKKSGLIVDTTGKGREHPIFMFLDSNDNYICEVRYGGASANALQRGLWTHTKNATNYFDSITNGWIDYSHNHALVRLFSLALNSTEQGHNEANIILQKDIDRLKITP